MKITFILLTNSLILMLLLLLISTVQKHFNSYKDKWSQFECGFSSMNPSHVPFSFQFFLIAILFLIFDIEIAFILSFPLEAFSLKNMLMIFLFIMILVLGFIYEWQKSNIDWSE